VISASRSQAGPGAIERVALADRTEVQLDPSRVKLTVPPSRFSCTPSNPTATRAVVISSPPGRHPSVLSTDELSGAPRRTPQQRLGGTCVIPRNPGRARHVDVPPRLTLPRPPITGRRYEAIRGIRDARTDPATVPDESLNHADQPVVHQPMRDAQSLPRE
jgi:hypothetical protein